MKLKIDFKQKKEDHLNFVFFTLIFSIIFFNLTSYFIASSLFIIFYTLFSHHYLLIFPIAIIVLAYLLRMVSYSYNLDTLDFIKFYKWIEILKIVKIEQAIRRFVFTFLIVAYSISFLNFTGITETKVPFLDDFGLTEKYLIDSKDSKDEIVYLINLWKIDLKNVLESY